MPRFSKVGHHSVFRDGPRFTIHSGHGPMEGKFFFSVSHCQDAGPFVPVSFGLPLSITPRPGFPDGLVRTIEEYLFVFHQGKEEIRNPDPRYQPL